MAYWFYKDQPEKLAMIEAEWNTQKPPAAFNLMAIPNQKEMKNDWELRIPDVFRPVGDTLLEYTRCGVTSVCCSQ